MKYETIAYEKGKVSKIILNRPEKANAWNLTMVNELNDILDKFGEDEETRVIILTGASRWFSAGGGYY